VRYDEYAPRIGIAQMLDKRCAKCGAADALEMYPLSQNLMPPACCLCWLSSIARVEYTKQTPDRVHGAWSHTRESSGFLFKEPVIYANSAIPGKMLTTVATLRASCVSFVEIRVNHDNVRGENGRVGWFRRTVVYSRSTKNALAFYDALQTSEIISS